MPVGFGFFVSDIIAGIDLMTKVVNALKDAGEASADY
jgi:hypothetical protein